MGIDNYNAKMNAIADQTDQVRNLVRNRDKDLRHRAFTARHIFELLRNRPDDLVTLLTSIGLTINDLTTLGRDGLTKLNEDIPTMDVMMNLRNQRNDEFEKAI